MKKKLLMLLFVMTLTSVSLCGCQLSEAFNSQEEEENEEEEEEEEENESEEESVSGGEVTVGETAFYCTNIDGLYEGALSDERVLTLNNDIDCTFTRTITYQDGSIDVTTYEGTYVADGDSYIVSYSYYNEDYITTYIVKDDKIVEYSEEYVSDDYSEIEGTYTCESELGSMTLEVEANGDTTLWIDDTCYTGSVFIYDEEWDVMVDDENYENSYDLICEFNEDGTFTYYEYGYNTYIDFEGSYNADGELGEVTFDVAANGDVTAVVPVNGQNMTLTGSIYADLDDTNKMNITVYDENNTITADLYFTKNGESWTYTGYVAVYNYLPGYDTLDVDYYEY